MAQMKKMQKNSVKILECEYCRKIYKTKNGLISHQDNCHFKIKNDLEGTRFGDFCNTIYNIILGREVSFSTFSKSKSFNLVTDFCLFCNRINVIEPTFYLKWLLDNKISTKKWIIEETYSKYLKYYLANESPISALERTLIYLKDKNIEPDLSSTSIGNTLTMLENGRISPWYIFINLKTNFFTRASTDQINYFNRIFDKTLWDLKKKRYHNTIIRLRKDIFDYDEH